MAKSNTSARGWSTKYAFPICIFKCTTQKDAKTESVLTCCFLSSLGHDLNSSYCRKEGSTLDKIISHLCHTAECCFCLYHKAHATVSLSFQQSYWIKSLFFPHNIQSYDFLQQVSPVSKKITCRKSWLRLHSADWNSAHDMYYRYFPCRPTRSPSADFMLAIWCMISRGILLYGSCRFIQISVYRRMKANRSCWGSHPHTVWLDLWGLVAISCPLSTPCVSLLHLWDSWPEEFAVWLTPGRVTTLEYSCHLAETFPLFATSCFYSLCLQTAVSHPKQGF